MGVYQASWFNLYVTLTFQFFLQLQNGAKNPTYLRGVLWGFNELMQVKQTE